MAGGLESLPRRLNVSQMTYGKDIAAWQISGMLTGLGGTLMFISGLLFFIVIVWTLWKGAKGTVVEWPVATEMMHGPEEGWPVLDRWPVWIGLAVLLILIAWGPFFLTYQWNMVSPGYQPWG